MWVWLLVSALLARVLILGSEELINIILVIIGVGILLQQGQHLWASNNIVNYVIYLIIAVIL